VKRGGAKVAEIDAEEKTEGPEIGVPLSIRLKPGFIRRELEVEEVIEKVDAKKVRARFTLGPYLSASLCALRASAFRFRLAPSGSIRAGPLRA
jgi:hypothetical protein